MAKLDIFRIIKCNFMPQAVLISLVICPAAKAMCEDISARTDFYYQKSQEEIYNAREEEALGNKPGICYHLRKANEYYTRAVVNHELFLACLGSLNNQVINEYNEIIARLKHNNRAYQLRCAR